MMNPINYGALLLCTLISCCGNCSESKLSKKNNLSETNSSSIQSILGEPQFELFSK